MSYVARYLHHQGHRVTGVDMAEREVMGALRELGIEIYVGHNAPIPEDVDLVLTTPAVLMANPVDIQSARERGLRVQTWQEYLGTITAEKKTISICGTHGKSTTTAMTGIAMQELGLDPTVMVGTLVPAFGNTNLRLGDSPWLALESDEYHENFMSYSPTFVLCTGAEPDHLDYFKTAERYEQAFVDFFSKVPKDGAVFYHALDAKVAELVKRAGVHGIGVPGRDIRLQVPGAHNRANATLVAAFLEHIGQSAEAAEHALQAFTGTWRRQEQIGKTAQGATVFDDYAHHATEIRATLAALREAYPHATISAIFQPHQFSRTRLFLNDFAAAFGDADQAYILDIYESRDTEEDKKAVNSGDMVEKLKANGVMAQTVGTVEEAIAFFKAMPEQPGEHIIVCMGAGSITTVARSLVV